MSFSQIKFYALHSVPERNIMTQKCRKNLTPGFCLGPNGGPKLTFTEIVPVRKNQISPIFEKKLFFRLKTMYKLQFNYR